MYYFDTFFIHRNTQHIFHINRIPCPSESFRVPLIGCIVERRYLTETQKCNFSVSFGYEIICSFFSSASSALW